MAVKPSKGGEVNLCVSNDYLLPNGNKAKKNPSKLNFNNY